jgi:hypothetical protein
MSPRQALRIQRLAERHDMKVDEFVDAVLAHMAPPEQTDYLCRKLMEQLDWLLQGLPPERSPYVEQFEARLCDPFWNHAYSHPKAIEQVDATIDDFINVHAYAAFAGSA